MNGAAPITTRGALQGTALAVVAIGLIVAALGVIADPGEITPLEAPAEPSEGGRCPTMVAGTFPAVSAAELIECPNAYDQVTVVYTGEVVRAVLWRGDRAWVQLNDDRYALDVGPLPEHRTTVGGNSGIPVSIPASAARRVVHVGDYRHQGDVLRVTGTFHRVDPADGGGPTIQADEVTVQQPGRPVDRPTSRLRIGAAALVMVAAAGLALLNRSSRGAG